MSKVSLTGDKLGSTTSFTFTDTAGAMSGAISEGIEKVRIFSTNGCHLSVGNTTSITATTADAPFKEDIAEIIKVVEGQSVGAINDSGSLTTTGTMYVTELTK